MIAYISHAASLMHVTTETRAAFNLINQRMQTVFCKTECVPFLCEVSMKQWENVRNRIAAIGNKK